MLVEIGNSRQLQEWQIEVNSETGNPSRFLVLLLTPIVLQMVVLPSPGAQSLLLLRVRYCCQTRTALGVLHIYVGPTITFTVLGGRHPWTQSPRLRWSKTSVWIWLTCLDPTMTDMDALTGEQRTALAQLEAITNGADLDTQISLLESVNWDVQVGVCHCWLLLF